MTIHTEQVFEYLDTHPVSLYEGTFESLLEMIHYIYTAYNSIDSQAIRQGFRDFRSVIEQLSAQEQDDLFSAACKLCFEHEKTAFYHGITVGMHLMTEINGLP